jgi:hypothetical protein
MTARMQYLQNFIAPSGSSTTQLCLGWAQGTSTPMSGRGWGQRDALHRHTQRNCKTTIEISAEIIFERKQTEQQ